jgi:membrane fusion protein, multidrug efflux system
MRYVWPILGVILLIAGLSFVKWKQIDTLMKAGKAAESAGPPPEVVSSAKATRETWESTIPAVGTVETLKGVTLSNDAPGVVVAIRFESGATVKKGDVLMELDASVERAQLASATARKRLATSTLARTRALVAAGTLTAVQLEADEAALRTAEADVATLNAQIARKTVRAPFGGVLGIRSVNLGQYLNPGTAITVLQAIDVPFVDFTLPQERLDDVAVGTAVRLVFGGQTPVEGSIAAIDRTIDPISRAIHIRATAADKADKLRPGMFVNVMVVLPKQRSVVSIPATAIVHASYGNSVFVIEAKEGGSAPARVVRQQFVRTGETRGDFVAIEDGIKENEEVVTAGAFKLRNGVRVVVNNDDVKLDPKLSPRPENH